MKKLIVIIVVMVVLAAGYWFYTQGKSTEGTGSKALDAEDNAMFRSMWAEFVRMTGESPNWVLDDAIKLYRNNSTQLGDFERHNGKALKSGALLVVIARSYQPWDFSKLNKDNWTKLFAMYQDWKANVNLNY